jgi:hypothetical protein
VIFAQLLAPPRIPHWFGPVRVHLIEDDGPRELGPRKWVPWRLVFCGMKPPSARQVAACWPLIGGA